jgi:bisphosphoglycerate-independent phosphoglycerate mutase (AlkP superfamily)
VKLRYVVLDRGLDSEIYKFSPDRTKEVVGELFNEKIELFDDFDEARDAAFVIISRYEKTAKGQRKNAFSFPQASRVRAIKRGLTGLTEDELEQYPT